MAALASVALVLLTFAAPASADMRRGILSYRHGTERPRIEYRVYWGVVDDATVRVAKVMLRAHNPEHPGSSRNWASVTVFVGGVHPGVGEHAWDGHGDWSAVAPAGDPAKQAGRVPPDLKREGAEVVWSTELYLGSGVWKTRYVPSDQRRSERYETWVRVRFHAPGRAQYWFRLTAPLG